MSLSHDLRGTARVDMVIQQGMEWYWPEALYYLAPASTMPDLTAWTATFRVFPDLDANAAPVISLTESSGITLGLMGSDEQTTTLASSASAGGASVTLTSGTGAAIGRHICIELDDGTIFVTTMASVAGATIGLTLPLPLAATSGNAVTHYAASHMVTNILLHLGHAATSVLEPWNQGLYNLDLIDAFGRPFVRYAGICCLEEGTIHGD